MAIELRNATDLEFVDISSERRREYRNASGVFHSVDEPQYLAISPSGNHRILDAAERCHAVDLAAGVAVIWTVHDGAPHFVR